MISEAQDRSRDGMRDMSQGDEKKEWEDSNRCLHPGQITLLRMPLSPYSIAVSRERPIIEALEAQ
jgi:hypothetical protein